MLPRPTPISPLKPNGTTVRPCKPITFQPYIVRPSAARIAPDLAKPSAAVTNEAIAATAIQSLYEPNSIPKPKGEAGKPGVGGYNVQVAMGWSEDDYKAVLVRAMFQSIFWEVTLDHDYSVKSKIYAMIT
jgi:hypothetical protein